MSNRYSCVNNRCIIKEDGEYSGENPCLESCNRIKYRCNRMEGKCVRDSIRGEYSHMEDCNNNCSSFNKYKCNILTGKCNNDPDGEEFMIDDCKETCNRNNQIIWISVAAFFALLFIGSLIYMFNQKKNTSTVSPILQQSSQLQQSPQSPQFQFRQ